MPTPSFLFDTYSIAERSLEPSALNDAICTAVRLGRNALEHERQAAFLAPLVAVGSISQEVLERIGADEDLAEILADCVQQKDESLDAFTSRLVETSNLSAIRVALAQMYQAEYGEGHDDLESARARRKAIRALCKATPPDVRCDLMQGDLQVADTAFLALPDFSILPAQRPRRPPELFA
jgi:hypothetical protein